MSQLFSVLSYVKIVSYYNKLCHDSFHGFYIITHFEAVKAKAMVKAVVINPTNSLDVIDASDASLYQVTG